MKKHLIIITLMYCVSAVKAQHISFSPESQMSTIDDVRHIEQLNQNRDGYSIKLDSVTSEITKIVLDYDNRLNCTQFFSYYNTGNEWLFDMGYEYAYDELNRIATMIDYRNSGTVIKAEYTYNEQSRIVEELYSTLDDGAWVIYGKNVFEYDDLGNMLSSKSYTFENDSWSEFKRIYFEYDGNLLISQVQYNYTYSWEPYRLFEYAYDNNGLRIEQVESHWFGGWDPWEKNKYYYNEQALCSEQIAYGWYDNVWDSIRRHTFEYDIEGNLICKTFFNRPVSSPDWVYSTKDEYFFDSNNNCISHASYSYDSSTNEWDLGYEDNMTFDLSTAANDIAGITLFWEEIKSGLGLKETSLHNKLVNMSIMDELILDFHYSLYDALNEQVGENITFWPNPTNETIYIEGSEIHEIILFDALGHKLKQFATNDEINVGSLKVGQYLLRVTLKDGSVFTKKIVKE